MKAIHLGIAVLWLSSFVAGREWREAAGALPIAATSAEITAQPVSSSGEGSPAPLREDHDTIDPRQDLLGNEIEDALADYRIDLGGIVYERHSPETAVPRLGSPGT